MTRTLTTMFYDGGCPVCLRGVRHYRRLDWARRLAWTDITREPGALAAFDVDLAEALGSLHVVTRDGVLVTGVPAFCAIWSELPGYRHLARLVRLPGIAFLAEAIYRRMIRGRAERRCSEMTCGVAPGSRGAAP